MLGIFFSVHSAVLIEDVPLKEEDHQNTWVPLTCLEIIYNQVCHSLDPEEECFRGIFCCSQRSNAVRYSILKVKFAVLVLFWYLEYWHWVRAMLSLTSVTAGIVLLLTIDAKWITRSTISRRSKTFYSFSSFLHTTLLVLNDSRNHRFF